MTGKLPILLATYTETILKAEVNYRHQITKTPSVKLAGELKLLPRMREIKVSLRRFAITAKMATVSLLSE